MLRGTNNRGCLMRNRKENCGKPCVGGETKEGVFQCEVWQVFAVKKRLKPFKRKNSWAFEKKLSTQECGETKEGGSPCFVYLRRISATAFGSIRLHASRTSYGKTIGSTGLIIASGGLKTTISQALNIFLLFLLKLLLKTPFLPLPMLYNTSV